MPSSLAVLALALATVPSPVAPVTAAEHTDPVTPPSSQPMPRAAPSRSAFGAAIAEMTRKLQDEAATKRATAETVDAAAARTAAVDRDE